MPTRPPPRHATPSQNHKRFSYQKNSFAYFSTFKHFVNIHSIAHFNVAVAASAGGGATVAANARWGLCRECVYLAIISSIKRWVFQGRVWAGDEPEFTFFV